MASTSSSTTDKGSQPYTYPSHVHAASFLSIKLSGKANYGPWKEQMICLLESRDMLGFIDGALEKPTQNNDSKYREWKRSDALVKGWIFGSLSEDVMGAVISQHTAKEVWLKLTETFSAPAPTNATIIKKYWPLYEAILSDDWEKAREIFNEDNDALTVKINDDGDSALHVAISTCEHIKFVENLLKEINQQELLPTLVNKWKSNPLHRAALIGNTKAAKLLVEENPSLLMVMDSNKYLPIHRAVFGSHKDTFLYLLKVTKEHIRLSEQDGCCNPFEGENSGVLLANVIISGFMDAAYDLLKEYPNMAREKKEKFIPLKYIAGKLDAYFSGTQYSSYQKFVYSCLEDMLEENDDADKAGETQDIENPDTNKAKIVAKGCRSCFNLVIRKINIVKFWKVALLNVVPQMKHLQKDKVKHNKALKVLRCICKEVVDSSSVDDIGEDYHAAITLALENDIPEAIQEIIRYIPQAIWTKHNDYRLTQFVIINRCEKVYNLLVHQMLVTDKHLHRTWHDKDGNNLLHLAGRLAPMDKLNLVSGAALQMQRELQWFEEVKNFVMHRHITKKNNHQETPIMVFRREHKDLRKEGEEWMKKTADSYTITAALIITIVFAAAITIPGGNDGNTGKAIFAKKFSFIIFAVSDAISLFSSTTSLLLFLSILTARYRDEDFLYSLPKRLIIGLAMLFLAVTTMMVAFSATLYIMFGQEKGWILIPIAALTCLPIASFVTLQLPLLVDLISSTYGHGIFDKQNGHRIK